MADTALSRQTDGRPAAPVRIIHLGLGHFFRAHPAYYTEHSDDADGWGIAAFSGRRATHVAELTAQDGCYTLVLQSGDTTTEVISSVVAVHTGDDMEALRAYARTPQVQVVTTTVTEAGYVRNRDGGLDTDNDDVEADIVALKADPAAALVATTPAKLVVIMLARREAGAGALTVVPCDNVVDNGAMAQRVTRDLAKAVDPSLLAWMDENVSFVTTMVDRITPNTTSADRDAVRRLTGRDDRAVVVTEPFTEWVLQGEFAGERPAWESAGAMLVDDIRPFEHRKLWLLNGAHSLMAYAGPILGKETVGEAIADERIRAWVEQWWAVATQHLPLPTDEVDAYCAALMDRFSNPSIRHKLSQIAPDGTQKMPIRFVPTLTEELKAGQVPAGATRPIAAWVLHLRGQGTPVNDSRGDEVQALAKGELEETVGKVLAYLGINDKRVSEQVLAQIDEIEKAAAVV